MLGAWVAAAGAAVAQEYIPVKGRLSDTDFYRVVACAATPGGPCQKPYLHWPEALRDGLPVGLVTMARDVPSYRAALYERGLTQAIAEINGLNAGLRLVRDDRAPLIKIHVVATPPGHVMRDTGVRALDGARLSLGRVALRATDGQITGALIAISAEARRREIGHIVLEELTQALGLMTDIKGVAYRRSIFSELGNSVLRLRGQDAMALRRHYDAEATLMNDADG